MIRSGGGRQNATAVNMGSAPGANATCSNEESLQPHPDFKDFWPELAGHKQPATRGIVGNAIHYGMQWVCGKRRHARFQFGQIDPAGDLTGIRLNDCDSILRQNVGVYLAVDELQLIQILDRLAAVEHFETAKIYANVLPQDRI